MKKIFITVFLLGHITFSQSIEKSTIDSGGAFASAGDIEVLYTIGETNVAEYTSASISLSEGFINAEFRVRVSPKVFLQGPLINPSTAGLMNDILREDNLLPSTSPYSDIAVINPNVFNLGGSSGIGTANDDIVDWLWLELRNDSDVGDIIIARSALLQRDGDVVDFDGVSNLVLPVAPKHYYLVLKHRNHLGVMSASPITLNASTTIVDFTNIGFSTYGSHAQTQLNSGNMAVWAGDVNQSNQIIFSGANSDANVIKDYVLADPSNGFNSVTFSSLGYLWIDVDMNGFGSFSGSGNDSNIIKDNVLAHPENGFGAATYIINTTVPSEN